MEPEANKGLRNDFQEALDKVDQEFLDEIVASQQEVNGKSALDVSVQDDGVSLEDIKSRATGLGRGNKELDAQLIYQFFQVGF